MQTSGQDGLVGQVVDGRYEVRSLLARGGMATVYVATDLRLERIVALKVMHPHLVHDQGFVTRFKREAKAAARLTHAHVVAVYDQGADGDLVYLAMEYVPGRTLRDIMRQYGPLTPEQALVFLDPVLEALGAAHAAGFVHRDIKPENVLIANDGRVKVADFGLARAVASDGESVTHGVIIGTVAYLSPEQVERGEADPRSDLYAAGILMFEMITGKVPHAGESPLSVAYQHVNNDVPAPSTIRPTLPPEIDALVIKATRRDPSLRYQSAAEFLADARRIRATLPAPLPLSNEQAASNETVVVDSSQAAAHGMTTRMTSPNAGPPPPPKRPQEPERYRRSKAPWIIIGILIAVLAAAFGGWFLASRMSVATPDVTGLTAPKASQALSAVDLTLVLAPEEFSETVEPGRIIRTDPEPGAGVRKGGSVSAVVSKGPERYNVPDVRGVEQSKAADELVSAGLAVGAITQAYDDKVALGDVVSTAPKVGAKVKKGTAVDLVVSKGPEPVPVPDLVGKKLGGARNALDKVGLKPNITERFSETIAAGAVISVKPKAGTIVDSGSTVNLVVSKGPPPVKVPDLIDMPRQKAINALNAIGLNANVVEGAATPLNRVYSQDPRPGKMIPRGSTVTIRVI